MATGKFKAVHGVFAAVAALAAISATPVLAAPERGICDETATPSLEITATEFSNAADADASIELLGPNFEFASREKPVRKKDETEQTESTVKEDAETESGDATVPAEAGPLVHKRQMYRRDI